MIHLFLNALAASAGGGITYIRNVLPHLAEHPDVRATVALTPTLKRELSAWPNVDLVECRASENAVRRFVFEQCELPRMIRDSKADILVSAGNFALWSCPVPQILLSRNSLYTSKVFARDLRWRGHFALLLDTRLKGVLASASVRRADVTVAPSEAFAEELRDWTGVRSPGRIVTIHHGFDEQAFVGNGETVHRDLIARLAKAVGTLRLLFVSHYNYYRNFETLLRALPLIAHQLPDLRIELALTCRLDVPEHSGKYRPSAAVDLRGALGDRTQLLELGAIPYTLLHHVYRSSDIYVTAAYTESFAHPLVEAMSMGLPVVASDIAVHREICGEAANYFPYLSAEELAHMVVKISTDSGLADAMRLRGLCQSKSFSWKRHVDDLIILGMKLAFGRGKSGYFKPTWQ